MGTADISGAKKDAVSPILPPSHRNVPPRADRFFTFLRWLRLSPSARAITALIFGFFAAIVLVDAVRSEIAADNRAQLAARLVSAALDNVATEDIAAGFEAVARALDADIRVGITGRDGAELIVANGSAIPDFTLLPAITAKHSIAGPLGTVETGIAQGTVLAPVLLHALIAFALAGAIAFFAARRAGMSDTLLRAHALHTAVAMASDGAVIWNRRQTLVTASEILQNMALVPPALLKRGTSYTRFLDGLRRTGDLTLLDATRLRRRLRLVLPVGETWEMHEYVTEDGLLVTYFNNDSERTRLRSEVKQLRGRVGEMAGEVQTQRVRGDAASRSKTLFLGQLSHSIRTPLNHIIGFADLLRHQSYGPLGDKRYLDYAGDIKQSGEALLETLSSMLEMAEFDSGYRTLARESIRLGDLFDWTAGRFGEQAKRAGLALIIERNDDIMVIGDGLYLKRLIGNIVDNSLKFTPAGGSLTLAAWPSDDGVVLEFTDTGIGIAPEMLHTLNTSFVLGNESRGNGIAIARAIAELSGGQLQINSSPGIGTTVAVVLPTKSGKPERKAEDGAQQVA
jgi:two-component system, cell cycle sensor histidine kinase PleC